LEVSQTGFRDCEKVAETRSLDPNIIVGKVMYGAVADQRIEIHVGKDWKDTHIYLDGQELHDVTQIQLTIEVDQPTLLQITQRFQQPPPDPGEPECWKLHIDAEGRAREGVE
jgi:hypothetical protein